jgi:hypothetical protein
VKIKETVMCWLAHVILAVILGLKYSPHIIPCSSQTILKRELREKMNNFPVLITAKKMLCINVLSQNVTA